jgi:hypothetical protein
VLGFGIVGELRLEECGRKVEAAVWRGNEGVGEVWQGAEIQQSTITSRISMHRIQSNRVHSLILRSYLLVTLDFMIEVPHKQSL